MRARQEGGIVAAAGRIGDDPAMISRRKAAGYVLGLAAAGAVVFVLASFAYGMLIWMGWLGR